MGEYEQLKTAIQQAIKQNGRGEITGELLQSTLVSLVNSVGLGATFGGIATPNTQVTSLDQNIYFLAYQDGTYSYFGGITLNNEVAFLSNGRGSWEKIAVGLERKQQYSPIIYATFLSEGSQIPHAEGYYLLGRSTTGTGVDSYIAHRKADDTLEYISPPTRTAFYIVVNKANGLVYTYDQMLGTYTLGINTFDYAKNRSKLFEDIENTFDLSGTRSDLDANIAETELLKYKTKNVLITHFQNILPLRGNTNEYYIDTNKSVGSTNIQYWEGDWKILPNKEKYILADKSNGYLYTYDSTQDKWVLLTDIASKIGDTSQLLTTSKTIVGAINEIYQLINKK